MIPILIAAGTALAIWKPKSGLPKKQARTEFGRMRVVSKKKHRRPVRLARAHGTKSIKNKPKSVIDAFPRGATIVKFKPLTADELTRLTGKMIAEKDPEKIRQIKEQIMEGFYGEKMVPV